MEGQDVWLEQLRASEESSEERVWWVGVADAVECCEDAVAVSCKEKGVERCDGLSDRCSAQDEQVLISSLSSFRSL